MRKIHKYVADDGTEFKTTAECESYEALSARLQEIDKILRPKPKDEGCNFANGYGFIQQSPDQVLRFKAAVYAEAIPYVSYLNLPDTLDKVNPWGIIGREIDGYCPEPIRRAWQRLRCIDAKSREWGQSFYATHPEDGQAVDIKAGETE